MNFLGAKHLLSNKRLSIMFLPLNLCIQSCCPIYIFVFQRFNRYICNVALFLFFFPLSSFLEVQHLYNKELWFFQVLGNAKGAVAVVVSILIFRNPVSVTGMLGYSLTVMGVILYSEAKKRSK